MNILEEAKQNLEEIIKDRRELHKIPELQLNLPKTVDYVKKRLEEMGIKYKLLVNGNAIIAQIGEKEGKCLAIRADMDALPIEEETNLPFASNHKGCMHACGHDGHTAMALAAAKILKNREEELKGIVKIFFQPGEEIPGGAEPMIKEGCMENPHVDRVIGLHEGGIFGNYEKGTIGYKKGPLMASMDAFILKVEGKGGHGARPKEFIDPIQIISEINMGLEKIISREIDPCESSLISICQIHGGTCQNIIPDQVWEEGTVRNLNEEVQDFVEERMKEITEGIAKAYRGKGHLDYKRYYPALINDEEFTEFAKETAVDLLGPEKVIEIEKPTMGGEDFAFYLKKAKGTFLALNNIRPAEDGKKYPHHSSKFDIEEDTLYIGAGVLGEVAYRYLNQEKSK